MRGRFPARSSHLTRRFSLACSRRREAKSRDCRSSVLPRSQLSLFFSRLSAWSRLSCQASSASGRLGAVVPKEGPAGIAMGKSDFLTPKAIANRIKSKGLQKLRWYCQMCQKQCRDEVSGAGSGPGPWGAGCEALESAAHPCAVSFLPRVGGTDVAKGLECYCR